MKANMMIQKVAAYVAGLAYGRGDEELAKDLGEWARADYPVVEETVRAVCLEHKCEDCAKRAMELTFPVLTEKNEQIAAANARIKEIERIRDGYRENAANYRDLVEKQDARIKELEAQQGLEQHKHVIRGRDVGCETCRNEALEEVAAFLELPTNKTWTSEKFAREIRSMKK